MMTQKTRTILADIDRLATVHSDENGVVALHQSIADETSLEHEAPDFSDVKLSLGEYLSAVKIVISETFDHEVWISAEIRSVNTKGGHYYFELAEKDEEGNITATARATLWRYRSGVVDRFIKATNQALTAGLAILFRGSASFHPQYGFSINISDIDPTYTLGALMQAYHAMLKRLHDAGLTTLNKSLPMPFDIRHVLVIAPENAAGLGDFRAEADRLAGAGACQFYYHHATFQGNHAPLEIRNAINHAISHFYDEYHHHADLLVIIRGGGAVGDLAYLNDYELSALVAESPMPVWVGVGHQRDKVLLDEVAHTRFDTPSKVIAAIENHLINTVALAKSAMQAICDKTLRHLVFAKEQSHLSMKSIHHHANQSVLLAKKDNDFLLNRLNAHAKHHILLHKNHLNDLLAHQQKTAHQILYRTSHEVRHLQSMILLQHPKRTLAKGYALVRQHEKLVSSKDDVRAGEIDILFCDGTVKAVVHNH